MAIRLSLIGFASSSIHLWITFHEQPSCSTNTSYIFTGTTRRVFIRKVRQPISMAMQFFEEIKSMIAHFHGQSNHLFNLS